MTQKDKLHDLLHLSGLRFKAAQAELSALLKKEADLRQNLAQLTQSKKDQANTTRDPDEAALVAGADIRWHQWVDQRRATINAELAQVLALQEYHRANLVRAFGRDQAVQELQEKAISAQEKIKKRRSDYES